MAKMKLQKLQSYLEDIDEFDNPKILLEQYPTTPHIAAVMLHEIQLKYGDIAGCSVLDLGCGCGILTIGSVIKGAAYVLGIDIDEEALEVCRRNLDEFEVSNVDLLQQDIVNISPKDSKDSQKMLSKNFDTVIMNPPFGTKKNAGIDMEFVRAALMMSTNAVYSLHKFKTREHLHKKAQDWGVSIEILGEFKFNVANTYKCHKEEEVDIKVIFVRFGHKK
ncbi:rRNA N6-adenosine-methyltransferase METTL5-like [Saccostrea cucullata]|uniref:rRNA N6-adenosine-methyltransferase METTL5-like n=1 Tax=Saccostrea cuccullata TaxID=36930 RepID=UPI002ED3C0FD